MKDFFSKRTTTIFIALLLALAVSCSSVMAWFVISEQDKIDGIEFYVGKDDDDISIEEVHGITVGSAYLLTPGNAIVLDISVDSSCSNLGISLEATASSFESMFGGRDDLISGAYKVGKSITTSAGTDYVYTTFDINEHLASITPSLTSTEIASLKEAFFKRYRDQYSIHEVLRVKVTSIDDVACDITLTKQESSEVYYAATALELTANQVLTIEIYYDNVTLTPTIEFLTTDDYAAYFAASANTTYIMENYNCFIGYTLQVSFVVPD